MTANSAKQLGDLNVEIAEQLQGLRRQLRSKLACDFDAEDLAQEACLKLYVELRRRDDIENPRAYLKQIARNLLYAHCTRAASRIVDTGVDVDTLIDPRAQPEDWANDAVRMESINRTCRELSPKCQQVLRMRWRDGLRVAEIAEKMDLSTGMIKKYLAQGVAHCRKRLGRMIEAERIAA